MKEILSIAAILGVALVLSSCGSSSGGTDNGALPDTVADVPVTDPGTEVAPADVPETTGETVVIDECGGTGDACAPTDIPTDVPDPKTDFTCVGTIEWPSPTATKYTVSYRVTDVFSKKAVAGATVKVCAEGDDACANPTATATTDADGRATVEVPAAPQGVGGYIEFSATDYPTTLAYYTYKDNIAVYGGTSVLIGALMLSSSTLDLMGKMIGYTPDATRGIVMFGARSCMDQDAPGVAVTADIADGSTTTIYLSNGLPDKTLTATVADGTGALLNVPAGNATITGTIAATSTVLGQVDVVVRAGAITTLNLGPTPL